MTDAISVMTPGGRLRHALKQQQPLQIVGATNTQMAKIAEYVGHEAIYLTSSDYLRGSQVLPEFGPRDESEIYEDSKRLAAATDLPLIVDIRFSPDSESVLGGRVYQICVSGAAGAVIGDECGSSNNIVSTEALVKRVRSAIYARRDDDFVIIARTSIYLKEGVDAAIERLQACVEEGADVVYVEGVSKLEDYRLLSNSIQAPIMAAIDEAEGTPLFNSQDLAKVGCAMVLYPHSAIRAMHKAAKLVYQTILSKGDPKDVLHLMQSIKK